jgi:hypothetical protein
MALHPEMLEAIRAIEEERAGADLKTVSPFQPGTLARIRSHGVKGLDGLVLAVCNKRVTLLIDILGRQQMVEVDHTMLAVS